MADVVSARVYDAEPGVTQVEAARRLRVHINTIPLMLADGRLRAGTPRGRYRTVDPESLRQLMALMDRPAPPWSQDAIVAAARAYRQYCGSVSTPSALQAMRVALDAAAKEDGR
jgi:hypothetical protein